MKIGSTRHLVMAPMGITDAIKTAPATIVGSPKFSIESLGLILKGPQSKSQQNHSVRVS
ncbi:MAG TPA: hypothetical protein VHQ92_01545 [Pseudolabrys sp.]|jgi:hypothetical protein|nr:hypothetical protein [Pseudolabrys sp.]